jgi:hypothetical protein
MDHNIQVDGSTKAGTVGGTLLILFINLSNAEVLKTVVLAAIGALVSFSVSMLLKIVVKRIRKK